MKILEVYICGKKGIPELCEDAYYTGENFIAVIDGATSKADKLIDAKTPGKMAADVICEEMEKMPASIKAFDAITMLNNAFYIRNNHFELDSLTKLRASVIVFSYYRHEIWSFGDCQCMINNKLYNTRKRIDVELAQKRSAAIQRLLASGYTYNQLLEDDLGRAEIMPFLREQYKLENTLGEYGYPQLNGGEIHENQLKVLDVPSGTEVILATDGYPQLKSTLKDSEETLAGLLREDPLCYYLNPSTKGLKMGNVSFDDRCYVKFVS